MKTPKAKKLPSGSWFVRVRINGQDVGITRPTEKEAVAEAMAVKAGIKQAETRSVAITLNQAIESYIVTRTNSVSPVTIRTYRIYQRNRFQSLLNVQISRITTSMVQQAANADAKKLSAKTMTATYGFLCSVLRENGIQVDAPTIPVVVPPDEPWLNKEQVKLFIKAVQGDKCEIPALLALHGLRMSEILDLEWKDVDLKNGIMRISGAAVPDENNKIVHKAENKNTTSNRPVPIMIPELKTLLERADKSGKYVNTVNHQTMRKRVNRICEKNGLPQVGIHGLRRSFASLGYHVGLSERELMTLGGWSDYHTMHKLYIKLSEADKMKAGNKIADFFKNGNEMTTTKPETA